jgi:zinc transporter, ZIP family
MGAAAFWSFVGASSLVLGALAGVYLSISPRVIGLVMGFGAGTLISAVAYDLVLEAYREAGQRSTLIGLSAGALLFWAGDWLLERRTGGEDPVVEATVSGPSLVLGALLDGVPESLAIGVTLIGGEPVSVAMVVAVFISNVPEGMAASVGLRQTGTPAARILGIWVGVVATCVVATAIGYQVLGSAPASTIAFIQAFAGGAILTMLANTMVPDAYRNGGREVGLVTVLGFIAASGLVVISA